MSAIHDAVEAGDEARLERLLRRGCLGLRGPNVNARNPSGLTPLHLAVSMGEAGIARLLMAKGARVNASDNDGHTPLHLAAGLGQVEAVALLLSSGADTGAADKDG